MARPREFDRDQVLAQATDLFWRRGWAGTTMDDLDAATGLKRGSLYNAFGDKQQLYLEALDHYGRQEIGAAVDLLGHSGLPQNAIPKLFKAAIAAVVERGDRRGCLLCNAAIERAPEDPQVEARVVAHLDGLRQAFADCLAAGCPPKDYADRRRIAEVADHLTASYMGLLVLAKAGFSASHLRRVAKSALGLLERL